jgi:hypothetical protein
MECTVAMVALAVTAVVAVAALVVALAVVAAVEPVGGVFIFFFFILFVWGLGVEYSVAQVVEGWSECGSGLVHPGCTSLQSLYWCVRVCPRRAIKL